MKPIYQLYPLTQPNLIWSFEIFLTVPLTPYGSYNTLAYVSSSTPSWWRIINKMWVPCDRQWWSSAEYSLMWHLYNKISTFKKDVKNLKTLCGPPPLTAIFLFSYFNLENFFPLENNSIYECYVSGSVLTFYIGHPNPCMDKKNKKYQNHNSKKTIRFCLTVINIYLKHNKKNNLLKLYIFDRKKT